MKNLALIFALFIAAGAGAQESTNLSFRFPIRVVNGQRVDLRYLFEHWHTEANAVTNSRWILVTGKITEDNRSGWVVDARTESASGVTLHQTVLIQNPPRSEKQRLENLMNQRKELETKSASLDSKANSLESGMTKPDHPHPYPEQAYNALNAPLPDNSLEVSNVLSQQSAVESEISQLDKEMEAIPNIDGTEYHVDFFVLYTGQIRNGMPVFDFGFPTR